MTGVADSPASVGVPLPSGVTVLHHDGDGPAPIQRFLDSCEPESDPQRRGAQVLLATMRHLWPDADLTELVTWVRTFSPKGAEPDAELILDVACAMGIGV